METKPPPRPSRTRLRSSPPAAGTALAGGPASGGDAISARIVAAARQHFFTLGFASCTMDCLARELGMSKKTLYQHFRSKEQIIDVLMAQKAESIRAGFEVVLGTPDLPFAERTARMMRHAMAEFSEVCAVFLHDLRRFMPAAYARLDEFRARVAPGIWERLLRSGIASGDVRADVDPVFVGHLIPIAMQTLVHPDTLQRLALQPHEMMQRFFRLLFSGVLTPQAQADYENSQPPRADATPPRV